MIPTVRQGDNCVTDYVANGFTYEWVFKAIEDAGIIGWQKHYEEI